MGSDCVTSLSSYLFTLHEISAEQFSFINYFIIIYILLFLILFLLLKRSFDQPSVLRRWSFCYFHFLWLFIIVTMRHFMLSLTLNPLLIFFSPV